MALIPREVKFFDMIEEMAAIVHRGARQLEAIFETRGGTLESLAQASAGIHDAEHEADELAHSFLERLNKTFITPLDREDLYHIIVRMDDVLDYVDAVAKRLVTFRIATPTPFATELARIIARSTEEITQAMGLLRDLKQIDRIHDRIARINQFENDGDQVLREALDDLFNGAPRDAIEIIKWKDLYEHLEIATDKCEDVANVIETVLVKNA